MKKLILVFAIVGLFGCNTTQPCNCNDNCPCSEKSCRCTKTNKCSDGCTCHDRPKHLEWKHIGD